MAARGVAREFEIVDLRRISHMLLDELLDEECAEWKRTLEWDFSSSAELVTRYVSMRSLDGIVLMDEGQAAGYCYFVTEGPKGLVGDLFVRQAHRTAQAEDVLLQAALDAIIRVPYIRRVEAQLMLLGERQPAPLLEAKRSYTFPRLFMLASLGRELPVGRKQPDCLFDTWTPRWISETAPLIAQTYEGHIDSEINDQYRDPAGAARFLENIVHYPGCGQFFQGASWLAAHQKTNELLGVSLASLVSADCGHVTQICVSPKAQATGIGYELLRRTMASLRGRGCRNVTLTVTAANEEAVALYRHAGFGVHHRFNANVWEGFI